MDRPTPYLPVATWDENEAFVRAVFARGYRFSRRNDLDATLASWRTSWSDYPYAWVHPAPRFEIDASQDLAGVVGKAATNSLPHFLAYLDRHFPRLP